MKANAPIAAPLDQVKIKTTKLPPPMRYARARSPRPPFERVQIRTPELPPPMRHGVGARLRPTWWMPASEVSASGLGGAQTVLVRIPRAPALPHDLDACLAFSQQVTPAEPSGGPAERAGETADAGPPSSSPGR